MATKREADLIEERFQTFSEANFVLSEYEALGSDNNMLPTFEGFKAFVVGVLDEYRFLRQNIQDNTNDS